MTWTLGLVATLGIVALAGAVLSVGVRDFLFETRDPEDLLMAFCMGIMLLAGIGGWL